MLKKVQAEYATQRYATRGRVPWSDMTVVMQTADAIK